MKILQYFRISHTEQSYTACLDKLCLLKGCSTPPNQQGLAIHTVIGVRVFTLQGPECFHITYYDHNLKINIEKKLLDQRAQVVTKGIYIYIYII